MTLPATLPGLCFFRSHHNLGGGRLAARTAVCTEPELPDHPGAVVRVFSVGAPRVSSIVSHFLPAWERGIPSPNFRKKDLQFERLWGESHNDESQNQPA